jgi:molecular chaperone GrpE
MKQALLSRFSAYLENLTGDDEPAEAPEQTTDLYSLLVEMAGLRNEVRTESRLVKEALDQFRGVFGTLEASQASLQQELERARNDTAERTRQAMRPLLLDVIDIRDRLTAALRLASTVRPHWTDRFRRRDEAGGNAWQEGLRMILRRIDQALLDRRVAPMQLAGRKFDPQRARVVATAADPAVAEGDVIEEVRPGFLWDDQVLRFAEVIVSKGEQT